MKMSHVRGAIALSAVILAVNAYAGDEDSKKAVVPMEQPAPSRWSLSIGAAVSSIKTTFNADPVLIDPADPAVGGGVYSGGPNPTLYRLGGSVGAGGPNADAINGVNGSTTFANPVAQVLPVATTSPIGILPGVAGSATYLGRTYTPLGGSDNTEPSVGPYIKLAYDLWDNRDKTIHLSPFFQYTFTTAFTSGPSYVGVNDVTTTYATYADGPSAVHPGAVFAVYNAAAAAPGLSGNFIDTPGADVNPTQVIATQVAVVGNGLNIYMHTFTLGFDLTKDLCDRVHLVLSTGPTLNLFDTDLSSSAGGLAVASNSKQTIRFGWIGQLGLVIDLDSRKRWFVETSGNYHYVDPFTVSDGLSTARVQASSWGAELGLGLHF